MPVGILSTPDTGFSHPKCYLSSLGGCDTTITNEHFISRNILEKLTKSTLRFKGASHFFGKDEADIGIDNFAAKVLCDRHNSILSPLDSSAGAFFSAMESFVGALLSDASTGNAVDLRLASGLDMERWLVKVFCGLTAARKIRGASGVPRPRSDLSPALLNALVGNTVLTPPLGIYSHAYPGQEREPRDLAFSTIKLSDGSDEVGGLFLSLGVMNFVLVTHSGYGTRFSDPHFFRHPPALFNVDTAEATLGFLLTY